MRIQEAARRVGCTQRAIKHYEEKGLLAVRKSENGYRDYTEEDISRLHAISAYRKLGIGLSDIRCLLDGEDQTLLCQILERKRAEQGARAQEIAALEAYLAGHDAAQLDESIDYETLSQAIRAQIPGFYGDYLISHFAPYLTHRIETEEQRDAYEKILAFWYSAHIRVPLLIRLSAIIQQRLIPHTQFSAEKLDELLRVMLHPTPEEYERIKRQTIASVRLRQNPLIRYSPGMIVQRRMMRALQDSGYNDIFIPQMKRLSPAYRAYHDALDAMNRRLADDLGLHYDSRYNLMISGSRDNAR